MNPQEFHYRLRHRVGGARPGSHPGSSLGAGQEFVSHMRLYDRPDPRRLDLRASLRNPGGDWLVRVHRQRTAVPVHVVADVSASMGFGLRRPKLHLLAEFVEALGRSAFRLGDTLGLLAFDARERDDLRVPASLGRGTGSAMAALLRNCTAVNAGSEGLEAALLPLAGRNGLVFLASDFHWPLERLEPALALLAHAQVVPLVVWDPAETEPPAANALAPLRDAETGRRRTLWLRPRLRDEWRAAVAQRRTELRSFFAARALRPFFLEGEFHAEAMSHYFLEAHA